MVKWLSKFVLDILPSVAATIIGAYIVNHYIIPKSPASPPAAAMASADPKADIKAESPDAKAVDLKSQPDKPAVEKASFEKASFEKASFEKGVAEKAAIERAAEKAAAEKAAAEKSADITGATDSRRHRPARDKAVADKPAAEKPAAKTPTPATVASVDPAPAAVPTPEERRDANEMARAAIDRLRGSSDAARTAETPRSDSARLQDTAHAAPAAIQPPSMQPLPPPIMVSTPNADVFSSGAGATITAPTNRATSRGDEPRRLAPPADIPASRPIDLHAEAALPDRRSVADDVMSAAKSVFHAVLPR